MNLFDTDKSIQSNNMIASYSHFLGPAGDFWSTGRQWSILKFWYSFWYLKPFFVWRAAKTKSIKLIIIGFMSYAFVVSNHFFAENLTTENTDVHVPHSLGEYERAHPIDC